LFIKGRAAEIVRDVPSANLLDLTPSSPMIGRKLLRHGRGRWLRLLEHQAARDLASLRGRVQGEAVEELRDAGATPEVIDIFRRVVHDDLRPAFTTPYRPSSPEWSILAETTNGKLLASVAKVGFGSIVLALVEPPHDRKLYERLTDPARGWTDCSSLLLPPSDDSPGETLDTGFHLARVGDGFEVTARKTVADIWPPVTSGEETAKVASQWPAVMRLYQDCHASRPMLEVPVELDTRAGPWRVPLDKLQPAMVSICADAVPPLLEVDIDLVGRGRTYLFAPIPKALVEKPPSEDLGDVPPAIRLIDLLLEVFAKKPLWRVERLPARRTLRLLCRTPHNLVPPEITLWAAGAELPQDRWEVDNTLPGQWLVRLLPSAAWTGSTLEVRVGDREERHFIEGFTSDEMERPLKLTPCNAAESHPQPWSGVLDALAIAGCPSRPPHTDDAVAYRGVIDLAFDDSETTRRQLEDFIQRFVRLRTKTETTRYWYLLALVLAVVGIAVRRRAAPGSWSYDPKGN
jgi:hypothetical protein